MTQFNSDVIDKGNPRRKLGFGAPPIQKGMGADSEPVRRFIARIAQDIRNPSYYLPIIESVTLHYGGPLTPQQVNANFGNKIDPFGCSPSSPPLGCLSVDSSFVKPGETQVDTLICGISFEVEPDPLIFTAKGNSFTKPTVGTAKPVSPDFWTQNDMNNFETGFNGLGLASGQQFEPAFLDWGGWTELAMYYMVRAYNLKWQMGNNHFLLNQSLRYIAYMPSNAQNGSSSASEQDIQYFSRRVNDYYANNLGSLFSFLPIDRTRVGSFTSALAGTPNVGVFRPTRAYETVGATYGAMGLRSYVRGNTEIQRLSAPYLMPGGIPIGLYAEVSNDDDKVLMQRYFDATQGFGGLAPPSFTEDQNINGGVPTAGTITTGYSQAGTAAFTGAELTLDPTPIMVAQQVPTGRHYYKGGPFKIRMAIRGWEVDEATSAAIRTPDITTAIQNACGCAFTINPR
jgi:hypothetical protein